MRHTHPTLLPAASHMVPGCPCSLARGCTLAPFPLPTVAPFTFAPALRPHCAPLARYLCLAPLRGSCICCVRTHTRAFTQAPASDEGVLAGMSPLFVEPLPPASARAAGRPAAVARVGGRPDRARFNRYNEWDSPAVVHASEGDGEEEEGEDRDGPLGAAPSRPYDGERPRCRPRVPTHRPMLFVVPALIGDERPVCCPRHRDLTAIPSQSTWWTGHPHVPLTAACTPL
jgi:hypothetical protein